MRHGPWTPLVVVAGVAVTGLAAAATAIGLARAWAQVQTEQSSQQGQTGRSGQWAGTLASIIGTAASIAA